MMMITTPQQSSMLSAASAFGAQTRLTQSRPTQAIWRDLSAELVVSADAWNRYGTDLSNGGTTTTGNDRSFAICRMHLPAFVKKEHSQRKRST